MSIVLFCSTIIHFRVSCSYKNVRPAQLQADAVVGCFSLLQGCYLLLVTKKRLHGSVCGEVISPSIESVSCSTAFAIINPSLGFLQAHRGASMIHKH